MADDFYDIRLLGFADFKASRRFLCALANEIWLSRWGRTPISVYRPGDVNTGKAMRAELEKSSRITVISAHGYLGDYGLGFCGSNHARTLLKANDIEYIGAKSMLLIDACRTPKLAPLIKSSAETRGLIVGLDRAAGEDDKDQETQGCDSVTALAAVIREICYPREKNLFRPAVKTAIAGVNSQIKARNSKDMRLIRVY